MKEIKRACELVEMISAMRLDLLSGRSKNPDATKAKIKLLTERKDLILRQISAALEQLENGTMGR